MVEPPSSSGAGRLTSGPSRPATNPSPFPAWEPPLPVVSGTPGSNEERIRLSLRIVVLLGRIGPPGEDGVAKPEATQQGIAAVLGVTQGAVSKVLRRLVAAEVVRQERHHVRGQDRRVRIYFLTRRGEGLEREIRERFELPSQFPPAGNRAGEGEVSPRTLSHPSRQGPGPVASALRSPR
jgi:DNA-binding MarR family transcriptional regulator